MVSRPAREQEIVPEDGGTITIHKGNEPGKTGLMRSK